MFCYKCGQETSESGRFCPSCGAQLLITPPETPSNAPPDTTPFYVARKIISVITVLFSFFVLFQSCTVGLGNTLEGNLEVSGTAGLILCICWWIAAIIQIGNTKKQQTIRAASITYLIGGIVSLLLSGNFYDLKLYGWATLVFSAICYLAYGQRLLDAIHKWTEDNSQ